MSQIEMFEWEQMTRSDLANLCAEMRNRYWQIRNLRKGRFGQAKLRAEYRKVAKMKEKLMLCGIEKREILDMIACYRLQCKATKQPFKHCKYCNQGRD